MDRDAHPGRGLWCVVARDHTPSRRLRLVGSFVLAAMLSAVAGTSGAADGSPNARRLGDTTDSLSTGADANEPAVRGERTQLAPLPPPPKICEPGALIRGVDVGDRKLVAFSFDDGPWPVNTQAVMATFEARGATATFFMIGDNVRRYPDIARDVASRGFEIANHSQTHVYRPSTIAAEVSVANETIRQATGVTPKLFRSPGLTEGSSIQAALAAQGMCNIFTTTDLGDWKSPRASSSVLCRRFASSLHNGEIVLLHDGGSHSASVQAIGCMLDVAAQRGFTVMSVGSLLGSGTPYGNRPSRFNALDPTGDESQSPRE